MLKWWSFTARTYAPRTHTPLVSYPSAWRPRVQYWVYTCTFYGEHEVKNSHHLSNGERERVRKSERASDSIDKAKFAWTIIIFITCIMIDILICQGICTSSTKLLKDFAMPFANFSSTSFSCYIFRSLNLSLNFFIYCSQSNSMKHFTLRSFKVIIWIQYFFLFCVFVYKPYHKFVSHFEDS